MAISPERALRSARAVDDDHVVVLVSVNGSVRTLVVADGGSER
jgi:hypothetical protein